MALLMLSAIRRKLVAPVFLATCLMPAFASRGYAQEASRFELLAGGIMGCVESCAYGLDVGGTGWLIEHLGGSARIHKFQELPATVDLMVRFRGFTVGTKSVEVDIGFGRSFPMDDHYRGGWSGEFLIGIRPYDRVGFKVGGGVETLGPRTSRGVGGFWRVSFLASIRP